MCAGNPRRDTPSAQAKQRILRIQRERILRDVLQSDALHFRLEHIAGGKLCVGACCPVAKRFVAADVLQLQRQIIGVIHVYRVEVGLCGVSLGLCGVRGGLLAAGSNPASSAFTILFFMFLLSFAVIDRRKNEKSHRRTCARGLKHPNRENYPFPHRPGSTVHAVHFITLID